MAEGSRNFAVYYFVTSALYLFISVLSYILIGRVAADCQSKCPMLINSNSVAYEACECWVENDADATNATFAPLNAFGWTPRPTEPDYQIPNPTTEQQYDRWQIIRDRVFDDEGVRALNCYVCSAPEDMTVWRACSSFGDCTIEGMLGFQPATNSIQAHDPSETCDTDPYLSDPPATAVLVAKTVTNRELMTTALWAISVFYSVMMICSIGCFVGYYMFRNKYGVDWSRLSRTERWFGVVCKVAPVLTRVANFLVLFFLVIALVNIFGPEPVCADALSSTGEKAYYRAVSRVLALTSAAWALVCVVGVFVQTWMPRDTPFYMPEFPTEANVAKRGRLKRAVAAGLHVVVTYGP